MSSLKTQRRAPVDDSHLPQHLSPVLRQLLAQRGVASEQELLLNAKGLLHFSALTDSERAAQRIARAIAEQQGICIVGDFDADGATSTALLMLALPEFGAQKLHYLVPNRFTDGYGLTPKLVDAAHAEGSQLIITVDNGIAAHAGVERANQLGMDVIITDHHLPGSSMPPAYAIVNPTRSDCAFASPNLAGVGVAFYLLLALRAWYRQQQHPAAGVNVAQWLDLVALGTVADVVSLDYNNRILVQQGLARIRAGQCRPGILALLKASGRDPAKLQATDLGFTVAPRINAAGRLDDIQIGIECLLSNDWQKVERLAGQLDGLNRERRQTEQGMREDAAAYLAELSFAEQKLPPVLSLHQSGWHQGVIGILAGRVKEQVYRPVIAFADADQGLLKGSARSVPGVHIRDLLERVYTLAPHTIQAFGGHAMAAGLTIEKIHYDEFTQVLQDVARDWIDDDILQQVVWSDGELTAAELSLSFAEQLAALGPWGQSFSEPVFDGVFRVAQQRIVGEKHLKLVVQPQFSNEGGSGQTVDAIAFNVDTTRWPDPQCNYLRLAYKLQLNEFRGKTSLQLLVEHLEPL
ncbi:single-stranded-DNA-specific exonuclease RecJ [Aliidiomarina soli]|uniref:Single-stranded-DNA-specific exonuclease RecJ n=1 Tax=Aliidiomarina soli TaxID=1928574 RepID=A0A432WLL6_9GAMM|nr:single-stranded-DNA-specific exonuclease RecJ [Aliidiomarina soli]RUO34683.1 single-stranded-DNA-specific exonuclease RecJ [Aliidiomarina soli]